MASEASSRIDILQRIAAAGIVGAGGGGFPTHVKLAAQAETVILNAAECEPLLHKDKELLRRYGREIVFGLTTAAELVGANDIAIGIKGKYTDVIETLTPLMPPDGRLVPLSDTYPTGDEFILVHDVTGKIIPPGAIPPSVGCVVLNVETAYNIARACQDNAPTKPGSIFSVTDKFLTVAGAVKTPCTLRVPVGISYGEAIELAGGATVERPRVLSGGAMMGRLVPMEEPITKTCGGAIVLSDDHPLVRRYEAPWKTIARIGAAACDQCSFCTESCPRYLLGHPIEPHKAMRSLGFVDDREPHVLGTQFCSECNLCTMMACPEGLDPRSVCARNKHQLAAEGKKWEADTHPYRAKLHLDNRRVPISRLILKLGLHPFNNTGPLIETDYQPKSVTLPFKQHVGAPARSVVSNGATVNKGQPVAKPDEGVLGAVIHASMSGVCRVEEDRVVITGTSGTHTNETMK